MKMHRKYGYLLLAAVLLSASVSCASAGRGSETEENTKKETDPVSESAPVTEEEISDNLPDTDLNDYDFRVLAFTQEHIDSFYSEGETGNIVGDAVYDKIRAVEERFNCNISLAEGCSMIEIGVSDEKKRYNDSILSGNDDFDLVTGHDITLANASLSGIFMNLYDIPHLSFDKPWWQQFTVESLSVGNQMYLFSNMFSYFAMAKTRVLYFNKELLASLDYESPYQSVLDHTWTLEKLTDIVKDSWNDLNGNSQKDRDDQCGYLASFYYSNYLECFGEEYYQHDAKGDISFVFDIEKNQKIVEKLYTLFDSAGTLIVEGDADIGELFPTGRFLFTYNKISAAAEFFSKSDLIYGILPMPLLDESQKEYRASCTDRPGAVPITADDHLEETGLIIEALSAEGYKKVYPAYFEIALKSRYADRSEDADMLDLIMNNAVLSFTYIYGNSSSPTSQMLFTLFNGNDRSTDVASYLATVERGQTKHAQSIAEAFKKLGK